MPDRDPKEVNEVPTENVGEVVQAFADEGYRRIDSERGDGDLWTLRASD